MRIAVGIEYDGSAYHGWQSQQLALCTIQDKVEAALSRIADQAIRVVCAGRTDTGVHATGQVVHFDTEVERTPDAWLLGANTYLPKDISFIWIKQVPDDFHARFSALARRYRYFIYNRSVRSAINHHRMSWYHRPLDLTRMQAAAAYLVGEHDFSSYRGMACQAASPVRRIYDLSLQQTEHVIQLDIRANAFLHHMVRNIAGVLMSIGAGKQEPIWAKEVLEARDRTQGGVTASPDGLYLMSVEYPEHFGLNRYD